MAKQKSLAPLLIIVLVAAFYGGFKGYVHYRVSSELDKAINMARPFADISYDGISSGLFDGSLVVERIRVVPQGSTEEASIDRVTLQGDGFGFWLKVATGVKQDDPPEKLSFRVDGFSVPLGGEYAAQYTGLMQGFSQQAGSLSLDGCAFGGWITPDQFRILGLDEFVIDMSLRYEYVKAINSFRASFEFGARDIENTAVDLSMTGLPQPGMVMMGAMPKFEEVTLNYQLDGEFAAKALGYCAEQEGVTVEAYVDSLFDAKKEQTARALGIEPGPGITEGLKQFLLKPEDFLLSFRPPPTLDYSQLFMYEPKDALSLLNTKLTINGIQVTDLSFEVADIPDDMDDGLLDFLGPTEEQRAQIEKKKERKKKPKIKLRYLDTALAELGSHVGRDVRLYLRGSDVVRKGELSSVADGEVNLVQRMHGGKMMAHVPLADIVRVEVLRPLKQEPASKN